MSGAQRVTNLPTTPPPAAAKKPPNTVRKVQQFIGEVMAIPMIPANIANQALAKATRFIAQALPSMPAARLMKDKVVGIPHAHGHPPNLIPPAPPIPLPNFGMVMASGAVSVLINGQPAVRCGDVGFEVWCGGLFPLFEMQTGSSHVFIGGARASRASDLAKHCLPSTALGKLAMAMAAASAVVGGLGVAADLIDMGDLDDAAADAGSPAEAAADAAASSAMATAAATAAAQTASDLAAVALAALQAAAGADPGIPPGIPAGALVTGSDNVKIGGFPMPGWGAILSGLGKLLKRVKARLRKGRIGAAGQRGRGIASPGPTDWFQQETPWSCGLACVRMIIYKLRGIDVSEEVLRRRSNFFNGRYRRFLGLDPHENLPPLLNDFLPGVGAYSNPHGNFPGLQRAAAEGPAVAVMHKFDSEGNEYGHGVIVDKVYQNEDGKYIMEGVDPAPLDNGGGPFVRDEGQFVNDGFRGGVIGTKPQGDLGPVADPPPPKP